MFNESVNNFTMGLYAFLSACRTIRLGNTRTVLQALSVALSA